MQLSLASIFDQDLACHYSKVIIRQLEIKSQLNLHFTWAKQLLRFKFKPKNSVRTIYFQLKTLKTQLFKLHFSFKIALN